MKTEIGSEFWDVPVTDSDNGMFPEDTKWFLSGRQALSFIIKDIQSKQEFRTVALPDWCCESIIRPFIDAGIEPVFYTVSVDEKGRFYQNISAACGCDAVYIMDFFGYSTVANFRSFPCVTIRDTTHSLFFNKPETDYVFGSLRKWAGFYTGGFAMAREGFAADIPVLPLNEDYYYTRRRAMELKREYLSNPGSVNKNDFLSLFAKGEEMLDAIKYIYCASQRDIDAARHFDVNIIKEKRRGNASVLLETVRDMAIFKDLGEDDCPLFVPILVPDGRRDELRKYLIGNDIYVPVHWPVSDIHTLDKPTLKLYENEISLVCDQRYDTDDMQRICNVIKEFYA